jgi:hypothetical protein
MMDQQQYSLCPRLLSTSDMTTVGRRRNLVETGEWRSCAGMIVLGQDHTNWRNTGGPDDLVGNMCTDRIVRAWKKSEATCNLYAIGWS